VQVAIYTDTGDNTVLRQVVIPIVGWDRCRNINSYFQYYLTQNMICAGPVGGGKSSCYGDSGGPLVCKQGDRWFEYGIVSFALSDLCAEPNSPVVYASVVAFQSWIQQQTGGTGISIINIQVLHYFDLELYFWLIWSPYFTCWPLHQIRSHCRLTYILGWWRLQCDDWCVSCCGNYACGLCYVA